MQRCPNQSQTATIARAQQIGKLIHSLLDGYPEVLALAQSLKAEDGLMGVEAILRFKPDLVVLDLMLPGKNGFEILQGSSSKSSTTVALAGTV